MSAAGFAADDRPALARTWNLVVHDDRAYIERTTDRQRVAALTAFEAVTMGLFDGRRTVGEVVEVVGQATGSEGRIAATRVASRLAPLLVSAGPRESPTSLDPLARVRVPRPDEGIRALPGPRVLHWWVTSVCPRRCVYCFAEPEHGASAPDATLPRARLAELFAEAQTLGAQSLLVAGAEPLLRPDLPEVLGDAIACGIEPVVTTKHTISAGYAKRLASAGLRHLSFSLDAVDDQANAALVGAPSYARQVRASMARLREVGIAFSLQAVATRRNPTTFEEVVALAVREGAIVVQVVPYEPVRRPIGSLDNDDLVLESDKPLRRRVAELQAEHPQLRVEVFQQLGSGDRAGYQCDIGMTKLFFLADGTVHRCYKLRYDPRLRGRNLLHTTIAAAWHDPGFRDVISPPRAAYAGSSCHGCDRFNGCHAEGRCIYQALVDHGRYEAPDRACDRNSRTVASTGAT